MVRRKIPKIGNEVLSILGQFKNPDHPISLKYECCREKAIAAIILKYKLRDRQVKSLILNLEKKIKKNNNKI
jgi:hypothetical protein